jgi:urea carboxylase-associated protein 1
MTGAPILDEVVEPRAPWSGIVERGSSLRIVDLEGNQAVDCLLYNVHDPAERYSAPDTIVEQGNIFLVVGSRLLSNEGRTLMTVTDTTCARHDTIGGACSQESNTLRYGFHTKHQHACVENFLLAHSWRGMGKRDMTSNINWFMNVPVEPDGTLGIVDGISAPGLFVELHAEMDVLVVISNCPQVNNPCNGFNPTAIRLVVSR